MFLRSKSQKIKQVVLTRYCIHRWRWELLVEVIGVSGENHLPVASYWQTLLYNVVSSTPWAGLKLTTLVVVGTTHWIILYPIVLCYVTDFKSFIVQYILKLWQSSWDQEMYNKLHEIQNPCTEYSRSSLFNKYNVTMSNSTMTLCIQYLVKSTCFIFCDFDRKNMGSVFHAICYTFPGKIYKIY
jgi:hypothetical protein